MTGNRFGAPGPPVRSWWHEAVFYRVELRSFADSNGDGVGDLNGLRDRLGYLEILGVDALWLTPLMDGPLDRDGVGRSVDPLLGDVKTFERLAAEAHESGMRVTIDVTVSRDGIAQPDVHNEVAQILRFWVERGVDGFRIGASPGVRTPADADVHKIVSIIRPVIDEYPHVGIGALIDGNWYACYAHADDLDIGVDFRLGSANYDAASIHNAIMNVLSSVSGANAPPMWVMASPDARRPVTRYGGDKLGRKRARAVALVQLALPGAAGLDNGEELGLPDSQMHGVRDPMPWEGSRPPFGFSDAAESWWPTAGSWAELTAEAEMEDPDSTLSLYRHALSVRKSHQGFRGSDIEWFGAPSGCLAFRRAGSTVTCALNTSAFSVPLPPGRLVLSSAPLIGGQLPPDTAVWLD